MQHTPWSIDVSTIPTRARVVYWLLDAAGQVLYVGMSDRPRDRVKMHLRHLDPPRPIASVWLEGFEHRDEAEAYERSLIDLLQPPCNDAGRTSGHFPLLRSYR